MSVSAGAARAAMRRFRPRDAAAILGQRGLLILAPHPDDESLGCGGLIAEAARRGRPPLVVQLTDGAGSHPGSRRYPPARLRALRKAEFLRANASLGVGRARVRALDLPDTAAPVDGPAFSRAVRRLAAIAARDRVGTICVSWPHDPHCDHEAAHAIAAATATRIGARLLCYPVWGLTLPAARDLPMARPVGMRLRVGRHRAAKRRAIAAHRSQHPGLITDDPGGFTLPPDMLALFRGPFEIYLRT